MAKRKSEMPFTAKWYSEANNLTVSHIGDYYYLCDNISILQISDLTYKLDFMPQSKRFVELKEGCGSSSVGRTWKREGVKTFDLIPDGNNFDKLLDKMQQGSEPIHRTALVIDADGFGTYQRLYKGKQIIVIKEAFDTIAMEVFPHITISGVHTVKYYGKSEKDAIVFKDPDNSCNIFAALPICFDSKELLNEVMALYN